MKSMPMKMENIDEEIAFGQIISKKVNAIISTDISCRLTQPTLNNAIPTTSNRLQNFSYAVHLILSSPATTHTKR